MDNANLAGAITLMPDDVDALRKDIQAIATQVAEIKALVQNEGQLCPWREAIARIVPSEARITALERDLVQVRIEMARASVLSGTAGGGVVGVIGAAMLVVGKVLKWW